jgi:cytidylate kinase
MGKGTTVVTISRQIGSGGSLIGQAVAQRLGMDFADREILRRASEEAGLSERCLADLEERPEGFWHSLLGAFTFVSPEVPYVPPPNPPVYEERLFAIERRIIRELAERRDVVIVGRAGFHVLADHPGLVSVGIQAPVEWRVKRLMQVRGGADEAQIRALVAATDRQREDFLRAVTGIPSFQAMIQQLHLGLDTAQLGLDEAIERIVHLVERRREAMRG